MPRVHSPDVQDVLLTWPGGERRLSPGERFEGPLPLSAPGAPRAGLHLKVHYLAGWRVALLQEGVQLLVDGVPVGEGPTTGPGHRLPREGLLTLRWSTSAVDIRVAQVSTAQGTPPPSADKRPRQDSTAPQQAQTLTMPGPAPTVPSSSWQQTRPAPSRPRTPPPPPRPQNSPQPLTSGARGTELTIGRRGGGCDIAVDGDDVALVQTRVSWRGSLAVVTSGRGGSGTLVEGHRILKAQLSPGDRFVVGRTEFTVGDRTLLRRDLQLPPSLEVVGLTARYPSRTVPAFHQVSFEVAAGQLMAIIGPSGVGKSSICRAVLGDMVREEGRVSLDGVPLGEEVGSTPLVSFVPQADAGVPELSVEDQLAYVARIRLAADIGRDRREVTGRVREVMRRLHLESVAGSRPADLSGGQRRRLSIAMELLSGPSLLILDEPTSGLDEGLDREVMRELAGLAARDCAVIVVTHAANNLDHASSVLAVASGSAPGSGTPAPSSTGYVGPPEDMLGAFGAASVADVMDRLREGRAAGAAAPQRARGVPSSRRTGPGHGGSRPAPAVGSSPPDIGVRAGALYWREAHRLLAQWRTILVLGVLVPVVAGLIAATPSSRGLAGNPQEINGPAVTTITILVVFLVFAAMALTLATLVGDAEMVRRERRWGVSLRTCVLARALVRVPLAVLQAVMAVVVLAVQRPGPEKVVADLPGWVLVGVFVVLLSLSCMALGMLLSALSSGMDRAVTWLASTGAGMIVLSGVVLELGNPDGVVGTACSWLAYLSPTRWTIAGIAAGIDLASFTRRFKDDALWTSDLQHVLVPLLVLTVSVPVLLALAVPALRRRLR